MYSLGALAQENRWEGHGHVWVTPAKSLCEGLVGKAGGGLCPCVPVSGSRLVWRKNLVPLVLKPPGM